jgi:methylated-DNA-[protein]-cysteine S-methyltransferase
MRGKYTMPCAVFDTPLGSCGLSWEGDLLTRFSLPPTPGVSSAGLPDFVARVIERVQEHLSGRLQDFSDLPFAWQRVGDFQRAIYQAALRVGPGQTATYGQLAKAIGQPLTAARAVGTALGQNPWPLLVPCHRFVGADGRMTGFSAPGGIQTKLRLLALEGSQLFAE